MRIWSLHPSLLDRRALVACWRETLLAQKVLRGLTRGYTNHPQLIRFRAHPQPLEAVAAYLSGLADEADARGYSFNRALIGAGEDNVDENSADKHSADEEENPYASVARIPVPLGQLEYELAFLQHKVAGRDPSGSTSCASAWRRAASWRRAHIRCLRWFRALLSPGKRRRTSRQRNF